MRDMRVHGRRYQQRKPLLLPKTFGNATTTLLLLEEEGDLLFLYKPLAITTQYS